MASCRLDPLGGGGGGGEKILGIGLVKGEGVRGKFWGGLWLVFFFLLF